MLKHIVKYILRWEAQLVLWRFHPKIIAITGSVGKTSLKEAVFAVLSKKRNVWRSPKSYNSEFGVPLTILGLASEWNSAWGWAKNIFKGLQAISARSYPEFLILEMGVDRPGDMDYMLGIAKPLVSVVTAIGEIPVHVEFFAGPPDIAREKGKIIEAVSSDGWSILNFDDDVVHDLRTRSRGQVVTFGFGKDADIVISQYKLLTNSGDTMQHPEGITFKIDYKGSTVPVRLKGALGKQQAYAAAAAVAVGSVLGLHLVEIVEGLSAYTPPPGRLVVIEGIKGTAILDDSYNASPMAMHAALDVLRDVPAKRRIAVLGDMLEIGKFTIPAHQAIGELIASYADALFAVGPRAKFIAKEAQERGMNQEYIFKFSSSRDAAPSIQEFIQAGDVILVKGSQSMRMERIIEEIMAHPEDASKLLVRQEEYWKNKE